jgi:acetoin utilization protein AcuB
MKYDISELMTHNPICLDSDDTLNNALSLMKKHNISHLLVKEETKLAGIISKEDILNKIIKLLSKTTGKTYTHYELNGFKVKDLMTRNPFSLTAEKSGTEAVKIMIKNKFHCIPIVNDANEPIGILTSFDIMSGNLLEK